MTTVLLRALLVLSLLGTAWIHFDMWLLGYRDIDVIGPLFMVNVVAGVLIALLAASWWHWLPMAAAVAFGVATLAAFTLSATVGLFSISGQSWGTRQVLSVLAEGGCVIIAAVLIPRARKARV